MASQFSTCMYACAYDICLYIGQYASPHMFVCVCACVEVVAETSKLLDDMIRVSHGSIIGKNDKCLTISDMYYARHIHVQVQYIYTRYEK